MPSKYARTQKRTDGTVPGKAAEEAGKQKRTDTKKKRRHGCRANRQENMARCQANKQERRNWKTHLVARLVANQCHKALDIAMEVAARPRASKRRRQEERNRASCPFESVWPWGASFPTENLGFQIFCLVFLDFHARIQS